MKFGSKFFGGTAIAICAVTSVSAAPYTTLDFTTFGRIDWGFDGVGYFGAKGADLAGKIFSLKTSITLPVNGEGDICYNGQFFNCWAGVGAVEVTATIGGVTFHTNVLPYEEAGAGIENSASGGQSGGVDGVSISTSGYLSDHGGVANINHYAGSYLPFVGPSYGFDLIVQHQVQPNDWAGAFVELDFFGIPDGHIIFGATNSNIERFVVNEVHEPASLALAGVGVFGLILTRRKAVAQRSC